ncbi:5-methyltetrahydropteroyltriglutamate--homocysteine S-methyltransferase [Halobacillus sp. A5]|uniref:5-methyltetrahydropteroyltriglutamate-- homocysteine S-methyltransferase n=1 Tax=Halobacillus sp. A5 TaxID=2880263 RepID=UPI0020A697DB|nr:5-methyltetrahydropteroyltriglutamate--homocysteine S-methyltransferase [Halobacillus sp. A5]MCP3026406.1 5-methyltetrahydropteroyltriglutamate--homocysteine S-methyltransferase [Halobacillus sp. A5]
MTKSSTLGYPRIGEKREWKKALEQYWKGNLQEEEFLTEIEGLRLHYLKKQKDRGIDLIPIGDFSLYDHVLDTAFMFGLIPDRFKVQDKSDLDTYFDMARGNESAVACEMTKWFNTNYHYIVPELQNDAEPSLLNNRVLHYFEEAKQKLGITGKPVILGPITLLKLSKGYQEEHFTTLLNKLVPLYVQVLKELENAGAEWVQIDEPVLSTTLDDKDISIFKEVYQTFNDELTSVKILLQTYFESVDYYEEVVSLPVAGIGLDFVHDEGANLLSLQKHGFPKDKTLAAGVINGRNIWRSDLKSSLAALNTITAIADKERLIVQPSCSLLHVPVTVETEHELNTELKNALAFADQKLEETTTLTEGLNKGEEAIRQRIEENSNARGALLSSASRNRLEVQKEVKFWKGVEPSRDQHHSTRQKLQQEYFNLPLLPTTTIGSLPQTTEIRQARMRWRKGDWDDVKYEEFIEANIREWIERQEDIGLDVLIHGEFERNDMVEFFGEKLDGFAFTRYAWVQSYGSRCVKPPIIYGDVALNEPMTVKEINYAQSQTAKPVKGMLTGPVTILNWSFVREDISQYDVTKQIALALQKEIKALEENQIQMIQVDEPALREGLPLKPAKQQTYLDEAVYAFKLATSAVNNETQIHTHMCYSEFGAIMETIDQLDADVISIETARSHGELITAFEEHSYEKGIGLGVYDIHSPRIPKVEEMERNIERALQVLDSRQFWVNPDCGLKTRGVTETTEALTNMVKAADNVRQRINKEEAVKEK